MRTSFIPYFGLEGLGILELDNEEDENVLHPSCLVCGTNYFGNRASKVRYRSQDQRQILGISKSEL